MFEFREVIKFGRFLRRQTSRLFLVDQVRDVVLGLLRGFKARTGIWRSASGDELNNFLVCSNHSVIVSLTIRRANTSGSGAGMGCTCDEKRQASAGGS